MPRSAAGSTPRASPRLQVGLGGGTRRRGRRRRRRGRPAPGRGARRRARRAGRPPRCRPAPTASQIDVAPFARSASIASRGPADRVSGVPLPDVPPAPRDGRCLGTPRRKLRDVVGGVQRRDPRCRPAWTRSAPRPRPRPAQRRRAGAPGAAPGRPPPPRSRGRDGESVDERELLRLVGRMAVECLAVDLSGARPGIRVHVPAPPATSRPAGPVGRAGHGGRSLCSTRCRRPTPRSVPQDQATTMPPSSTDTVFAGSGCLAGPRKHRAVRDREQRCCGTGRRSPRRPLALTLQPWWVQVAENALKSPARRLGDDHVLVGEHACRRRPGCPRWTVSAVLPLPGAADGRRGARVGRAESGAVAVEPPPQAVSSPTAATPPTPATSARRLRLPGRTGRPVAARPVSRSGCAAGWGRACGVM